MIWPVALDANNKSTQTSVTKKLEFLTWVEIKIIKGATSEIIFT